MRRRRGTGKRGVACHSAIRPPFPFHGPLGTRLVTLVALHRSERVKGSTLELVKVTKRYGQAVAVDAIDLRVRRRRLLLPARPVRLRQDLDPAHDRRPRGGDRRRHPPRRGQRHRPAARQARHGHDVPELRAVPASEPRSTTSPSSLKMRGVDKAARRAKAHGDARTRRHGRTMPSGCRRSCRAASSSASRSPARSSPSRRSCCWTSRCPRSIPSCASRCAPS